MADKEWLFPRLHFVLFSDKRKVTVYLYSSPCQNSINRNLMYYITNIYALKDIHTQLKHTKTAENKVKEVLKKLFNRQNNRIYVFLRNEKDLSLKSCNIILN